MKISEIRIDTEEVSVAYEDGRYNLNSYTLSFRDARAVAAALNRIADIVEGETEVEE